MAVRPSPTAFVTWAHAGEGWPPEVVAGWAAEVYAFCRLLRQQGIDADADVFHFHEPGVNWHHFGPRAIADRDYTLIAVSEPWKQRWEGRNDPRVGAGAAAEANALHGLFARDQAEFRRKVVLVELPSMIGVGAIPDALAGFQRFAIGGFTNAYCEGLVRLLTGQPRVPLPPLGKVPDLPPSPPTSARGPSLPESDNESEDGTSLQAKAIADAEREVAAAEALLDRRGLPRTRATTPGFGAGRVPKSKGQQYPPDPLTEDEVVALLTYLDDPSSKYETGGGSASRVRLQALIAVLWRSGLRISEALNLEPRDLRPANRCIVVRSGVRGTDRVVAMDSWGWTYLEAWMDARRALPPGPIFCVVTGSSVGERWSHADVRRQLKRVAEGAGVKRRVAPQQFRHAHAMQLWEEGVDIRAIRHQLGSSRLDKVLSYLDGLAPEAAVAPIRDRKPPGSERSA